MANFGVHRTLLGDPSECVWYPRASYVKPWTSFGDPRGHLGDPLIELRICYTVSVRVLVNISIKYIDIINFIVMSGRLFRLYL